MPTPTMQEALRVAAIARQLRRAEMGDARSWREVRDSISSEPAGNNEYASECARLLVERHVARARRWNRQLVIAQRALRVGLFAPQRGRPSFVPAGQAVRP